MDWKNLEQYGFLGPIVGIAGLFLGAGAAILFGWTKTFDTWKPPADVLPEPLSRMVTMLCAIAIFMAWILAEPQRETAYIHAVIWLAAGGVAAFLIYVGLRTYCGRFRKPLVNAAGQPAGEEVIWGGFWTTPSAQSATEKGATLEAFLAGNQYSKGAVWPPFSLTISAVLAAFVLLSTLVCGTAAISTAATTAQVALTKKPARAVFGSSDVPGLAPEKSGEKPPNK